MQESRQLATIQPNPFRLESITHQWTPGETVADILAAVDYDDRHWSGARVFLNDQLIDPQYYHVVRPHADVIIAIKVMPEGGDNSMLRTVAFIALAVAVSMIPGAQGWGHAFLKAGVFAAGTLAINAIIPLKSPELDNGSSESQALSVGAARNRLTPFGNVPTLCGFYQITPPYASRAYTELVGEDQYVVMLFTLGFMNIEVDRSSIRLGNSFAYDYDDVEIELLTGGSDDDAAITLYSGTVFEDNVGKIIPGDTESGYANHSSIQDCDRLTYEIHFPRGLIKYENNDGKRRKQKVIITVEYSDDPNGGWQEVPKSPHTITAVTSVLLRKGFTWTPPYRGQWHLRMRANIKNRDGSGDVADGPVFSDERFFQILRNYKTDPAITDPSISQVAMRIKASDQLSGVPDQVSMYAQSIIPDWTGSAWVEGITNNPASLIRWMLTGKPNARALDESKLNNDSFVAFWQYCEDENLKFNQNIDSNRTIFEMINTIGRAAFARPLELDGIWHIVIDQKQTVPRQIFTPRNTRSLSGSKSFPEQPEGFRMRFVDETDRKYTQEERIVYADGFSESNNTGFFESLEAIGVTNPDQIWKIGRRYLAISVLQPETFTFDVDVENLVTVTGDMVLLQHDALKQGLGTARVLDISTTTVTLDSAVGMDGIDDNGEPVSYGLQFRHSDATIDVAQVNTQTGLFDTLTFTVPGDYGAIGDLAVFGELDRISQQVIIKNISPGRDLSAKLTCIPYNDDVYLSDTQTIPAYDPLTTEPSGATIPVIQSIQSDEYVMYRDSAGTLMPRMVISLAFVAERVNVAGIIVQFRVFSSDENNAVVWTSLALLPGDTGVFWIDGVNELAQIEIRTRFLLNDGTSGIWGYYFDYDKGTPYHTVVGKTNPPPALSYLEVVPQASGLREYRFGYFDDVNLPPDVDGWQIRYYDTDALTGQPVEYALLDGDTYGLQDPNNQEGDYYALQLEASLPNWEDMTPLTLGVIKHEPFEYNAPFQGTWIFAAVTIDVGGLISRPFYTSAITLPAPQLGNSLFYLDCAANNWLEPPTDPPGLFTDCSVAPSTRYLIGDSSQDWDSGSWAAAGTWQGSPVTSYTYTLSPGVISFDTALTSNIRVGFTTDTGLVPQGTFIFRYAIDGGTFTGNEIADDETITNPGTITTIEFQMEVSGAKDEGVRNWIIEGFASAT